MKIITKISSILIITVLILSCIVLPVSAKGTTLYFSKNNIQVGDNVTVTVSLKAEESMNNLSFFLNYDSSVLEFTSGDGNKSKDGVINVTKNPNGEKSSSCSFTFKAISNGKSSISVTDCFYEKPNLDDQFVITGATAILTVEGEEKSNNSKLKTLKIEGYNLKPSFSSSKTNYSLTVPFDINKVKVSATTTDSKAKIKSISGENNLKVGVNTVTVKVEAENGDVTDYIIKVTREKEAEDTQNEIDNEVIENNDNSESQITNNLTSLETVIDGSTYTITTDIPKDVLLPGFDIEEVKINGYTVETAVDTNRNYVLYYLSGPNSDKLEPYLYHKQNDLFEKLVYFTVGENTYIVSKFPDDINLPDSLYATNLTIGDSSAECYADSDTNFADYKYLYCYFNGKYSVYRYDTVENTIQRYPDFNYNSYSKSTDDDSFLKRFSSLSSNGKVIIIALLIVVLSILGLFIMLIVYLIKQTSNYRKDIEYYDDDDIFDEVEMNNNK